MQVQDKPVESNFAWIAAAITVVIIYGSLYPFHFREISGLSHSAGALIKTWRGPFGRGDFVANVLLYVPYGCSWRQSLRRLPGSVRIGFTVFSGLALSAGMELLQFYEPGRMSTLSDVYSNTIGVVVGSVAGALLFQYPISWRAGAAERRTFPVLLIVCWLGYRLFPYVPVIDLHKYWTAVKPLAVSPVLSPVDLYRHTAIWLAVALLIETLVGKSLSRVTLFALLVGVLFARVLIVDAELSAGEVAGGIIAWLIWYGVVSRLQLRAPIIALLFAGAVVMDGLRPFQFSAIARPFGWIPFAGFIQGAVDVNVRSFFEKLFNYGTLTWLIARAGVRFAIAVGLSAGLVLCLELIQAFLPGRSAEITDPILVLLTAGLMKSMGESPAKATAIVASQRA